MKGPKRTQLVVLVQPATKKRLARCSEVTGISITRLLERAADVFEASTLKHIKLEEHSRYLTGKLTALEAFGQNRLLKKTIPDVPRVVLSAKVSADAKKKLDRCAAFWGIPLANVVYRMARDWEKSVLTRLKPELQADFLAGKLDREALFPLTEIDEASDA